MNSLLETNRFPTGFCALASGVCIGMYMYRKNVKSQHVETFFCKCKPDLKGKVVVLITASKGVCYETALSCARLGATVVFGAVNMKTGNDLASTLRTRSKNGSVLCLPLDLSDFSSCSSFSVSVKSLHPTISYLVLNCPGEEIIGDMTVNECNITWQKNCLSLIVIAENLKHCFNNSIRGNEGIVIVSPTPNENMEMNEDDLKYIFKVPDFPRQKSTDVAKSKYSLLLYASYLARTKSRIDCYNVAYVDLGQVISIKINESSKFNCFKSRALQNDLKTTSEVVQTLIHCINSPNLVNGAVMKDGHYVNKELCGYCNSKSDNFVRCMLKALDEHVVLKLNVV